MSSTSQERAFINGRIYTLAEPAWVEALLVRDGRIAALGTTAEVLRRAAEAAKIIDLKGKAVLPGFIDAHTHLVSTGLTRTVYLDLSGARSLEELLEQVRGELARRAEGEWLVGRGWDESRWPERRYVTRRELDRVAPANPVALFRVDGHLLVVNSRALKEVPLPQARLKGGKADLERGWLWEEAAWWFHEQIKPDLAHLKKAIMAGVELAHSHGLTSIHEIARPRYLRAYQELRREGRLRLRVYLNLMSEQMEELIGLGLETTFGDEWLRLGGVKLFADGSIGAGNAALSEPYRDRGGRGELNHTPEELRRFVERARAHGLQVMIHAIGDRAIEAALEAYERAGVTPQERHRIEHFELATPEQVERAARLGVVLSMQPNFLQWAAPGGLYEARLGKERARRINPHRWVLDAGGRLAFGSDCMPLGPLFGLQQVVNAPQPVQRLTLEEALRCYTQGGAYASFEEGLKGSLEVGKLADLVVLSEDPFAEPGGLAEIQVEMTFIGGELVFSRSQDG